MSELLSVALWLGVTSFYLGLLLYALPVPNLSIKRWGRTLAQDGLFVSFLVFAFKFLVYLGDVILLKFEMNKSEILAELQRAYMNSVFMYSGISTLKKAWSSLITPLLENVPQSNVVLPLSKIIGAAVAYLLNNLIVATAITNMITRFYLIASSLWLLLYALYVFTLTYFQFIVAVGIFFVAIPFRVMRPAGASLIGFAYSVYVVLPLVLFINEMMLGYLPSDMSWFLKLTVPFSEYLTHITKNDVVYTSGYVKDYNNKGIPYAVVAFCDTKMNCGYYVTNEQGFFDATYPFGGVPWPITFVKIYIFGIRALNKVMDWRLYFPSPDKADQVLFKLNNVFMSHEGFYLIVNGLIKLDEEPKLTVDPYGTVSYTTAFTIRRDNTTVYIVTSGVIEPSTIRFEVFRKGAFRQAEAKSYLWGNVEVWSLIINGDSGAYVKVKISGKHTYFVPPRVGNIGYVEVTAARELSSATIVTTTQNPILLFPFLVAVLPLMDLMIISLSAYGIASLLSGGVRSLVRKVW